MAHNSDVHRILFDRLKRRTLLSDLDETAIGKLTIPVRRHDRFARIARAGHRPGTCGFIITGYAIRYRITASGTRQVVTLLQPGDLIGLQQIVFPRTDYDVEALTAMQVGDVPTDQLDALVLSRPAIARAIWIETLVENSILRESLLNTGRRNALARVAHQLCELAHRLSSTVQPMRSFEMPLTQERLGDMIGLTSVHTNRMLKVIRERGLATQSGGRVLVHDWPGLRHLASFSPEYLRLECR